jgi:Antitoxin MazE-like
MATPPRKAKRTKPRTPRQRMAARRERLRAQGLRPVQHWVPDLRDPKVKADLRRQAKMLARHPENAAIDDWIEAVYDWDAWR